MLHEPDWAQVGFVFCLSNSSEFSSNEEIISPINHNISVALVFCQQYFFQNVLHYIRGIGCKVHFLEDNETLLFF